MELRLTNPNRSAFTLVEMMVAVAVGCLVLAGATTLFVFSMRSFASMANYSDLNQKSRYASDLISRDIRSSLCVSNATASQLDLKLPDGSTTYTYDSDAGTLSRTKNGTTTVLLSGVDSLKFTLYQRPDSSSAYEQFPIATPDNAKLVAFQWSCSRKLTGSQSNSENLEAAIVELRNQ